MIGLSFLRNTLKTCRWTTPLVAIELIYSVASSKNIGKIREGWRARAKDAKEKDKEKGVGNFYKYYRYEAYIHKIAIFKIFFDV